MFPITIQLVILLLIRAQEEDKKDKLEANASLAAPTEISVDAVLAAFLSSNQWPFGI